VPRMSAALAKTEKDWAERAARHIKAELKRADLTYDDLAERLKKHGFKETKASIANKLARATMPAAFFLACLAAMELEGVVLEEI
jgi:virulence-associated protein VapD